MSFLAAVANGVKRDLQEHGWSRRSDLPEHFADNVLAEPSHLVELSRQIGFVVPQTHRNNLVARIENLGKAYADPRVRGHQTNSELAFHSDRCDVNVLLYVRVAPAGGALSVVSYEEAAARMERMHPGLLAVLYADFPFDMRDERIFPDMLWCMRPILWSARGGVRGHYIRRFISDSQRHADCPRLSAVQMEALDAFDDVLQQLRAERTFEPKAGQLVALDNFRVMHARQAYDDGPDSGTGRLAMRTWLAPYASEALPEFCLPMMGATKAGTFRGGVGVGPAYTQLLGTQGHFNEESAT